ETHGVAIAVDISGLCALGWLRPLAPTWCMILRDNRKRRAVIGHSESRHAADHMRADRVESERLLVLVTAGERLELVFRLTIDSYQLFRLGVIRFERLIGERPVARGLRYVAVGVAI